MQTTYDDRHLRARNPFLWVIVAIATIATIAIVFFVGAALAHYYYPAGMMPYYGYGYSWGGWWFFPFGFFFFLIFLFFIFRLAFWGWGWGGGWRRRYWYGYEDAHEILRQRYARGEIAKEQFDQMTRDLEQHK